MTIEMDTYAAFINSNRRSTFFNATPEQNLENKSDNGIEIKYLREFLWMVLSRILEGDLIPMKLKMFLKQVGDYYPNNSMTREILKNAKPYKIKFICRENQGRSQIAERIVRFLAEAVGLNVEVSSAGYEATPDKYDEQKPSPLVQHFMKLFGTPLDNAKVKQFHLDDVDDETIVVVLDKAIPLEELAQKAKILIKHFMKDPAPGNETGADNTEKIVDLIEEICVIAVEVVFILTEATIASNFELVTQFFGQFRGLSEIDMQEEN